VDCGVFGEMRPLSQVQLWVFIIIYGVQGVFTLLNLYFPIQRPTQDCMDSPYGPNGSTLRSWMLGIGITELVLLTLGLVDILLYKKRCLLDLPFKVITIILLFLLGIKVLVWAAVQAYMFRVGMASLCSGGLFAYGLVLMVLHLSLLIIGGCFSLSRIYG
jgi:hypothetical protein